MCQDDDILSQIKLFRLTKLGGVEYMLCTFELDAIYECMKTLVAMCTYQYSLQTQIVKECLDLSLSSLDQC